MTINEHLPNNKAALKRRKI